MAYHGDLDPSMTVDFDFTTVAATGAPTALVGGALKVRKDNSLTTSVAGVTLSVNLDLDGAGAVAGLNWVRITLTSDGTFYSSGSRFQVIVSAGTIGGVSAVGYVAGDFSIRADSALKPTTAGRTADVTALGAVTADNMLTVEQIADEVATRELIAGTVLDKVGYALSSAGIIAIWSAATRELTGFGTLVAQVATAVWGAAARTLTDLGFTVTDVAAIKAKTDALPTDPADQSLVIAATDAVMARLGAPAGASVSADMAAVKAETASIQTDTNDLQTRVPAALVSGRMDASVGAMAANVLTAAAAAADLTTELQGGLATAAALTTAQADLTTIVSAIDPTGAADIDAIKAKTEQLTFTTPNVVDSTGSGASAAAVADAVWDEALAGHVAAGSTGEALTASGGAGDPWITALPGAYGAGSAGKIVGDRIAASVAGAVGSVTGNVGGNVVGSVASVTGAVGSVTVVTDKTGYRLSSAGVDDMLRTALVESYAADGAPGTLSEMLFMIQQALTEKAIVTTVMTVKKLDGSTTAATFNLNSATTPTAITRAT